MPQVSIFMTCDNCVAQTRRFNTHSRALLPAFAIPFGFSPLTPLLFCVTESCSWNNLYTVLIRLSLCFLLAHPQEPHSRFYEPIHIRWLSPLRGARRKLTKTIVLIKLDCIRKWIFTDSDFKREWLWRWGNDLDGVGFASLVSFVEGFAGDFESVVGWFGCFEAFWSVLMCLGTLSWLQIASED